MIPLCDLATREQVIALQTLYSRWEAHAIELGADRRAARLTWASEAVGRSISSFSDLRHEEARGLIDLLKASLGQAVGHGKAKPWRKVGARDRAQAAGTAGRREGEPEFIQMASADDLARIAEMLRRLQWTREQFDAWLQSPRSPLSSGDATIRTVRQANRVYWALKAMLTRSGGWQKRGGRKPSRAAHSEQLEEVRTRTSLA